MLTTRYLTKKLCQAAQKMLPELQSAHSVKHHGKISDCGECAFTVGVGKGDMKKKFLITVREICEVKG